MNNTNIVTQVEEELIRWLVHKRNYVTKLDDINRALAAGRIRENHFARDLHKFIFHPKTRSMMVSEENRDLQPLRIVECLIARYSVDMRIPWTRRVTHTATSRQDIWRYVWFCIERLAFSRRYRDYIRSKVRAFLLLRFKRLVQRLLYKNIIKKCIMESYYINEDNMAQVLSYL